jgi:alkanesulfonate monooxygenase SsuD/methylene tetrahydromethanopterin reductase-like flavin-dependent oxidoreductase (luciferase family)
LFSANRLELGVGAASPSASTAGGLRYDSAAERVARFDEYLQVVKAPARRSPFSFSGHYYTLQDYQPLPHQTPPPILVGGGSPRVLATAGRYADIISIATRATPDSRIDSRNLTLQAVEQKLATIRESAGERFAQIELNMTVRDVQITQDRRAAASDLLNRWQSGPYYADAKPKRSPKTTC